MGVRDAFIRRLGQKHLIFPGFLVNSSALRPL
jgi:hypothetical protein